MSVVRVPCKVIPGARMNGITGVHAGELVVRLTAPPERGKANAALVRLLAERLEVARSSISVVRGHTSRHKIVSVPDAAAGRVQALIASVS